MKHALLVLQGQAVRTIHHPQRKAGQNFAAAILTLIAIGIALDPAPVAVSEGKTAETDNARPATPIRLKGVDLDGRLRRLGESHGCRAVAVVFLSIRCPISNSSIPTLGKLKAKFKRRGVEFYGVISNPAVTRTAAVLHEKQYSIPFPVLFDASCELRRRLKPTHTPQAIVLSPEGGVRYSGRIDDRFASIGRKRDAASVHDLHDALESVVSGQAVEIASTKPIGCLLEDDSAPGAAGDVTFNRDIAPLILTNCSECHRPGESAPFPLLTYQDVSSHAKQIAAVIGSTFMPPWHPVEGFGHFRDERRLNDDEIALIQRWVAAGRPEGKPEDHPDSPDFVQGWRLGKPDLVLRMSEPFELAADGPDVHQHFVLRTGLRRNRIVSAVEFRPGNPRVVHHACFYVDTTKAARRLDRIDPDVGYGGSPGPGFLNIGAFRSWLPGMSPRRLPEGTGRMLPARSDIVLEIHYQRSGKPEIDRSSLGIFFAKSATKQLVSEIQVMNKTLDIPPGASRHRHHASYTLPVDATLLDAAPHMHLLGREMKATATLPDGEVKPLIWIKDWDFNWQGQYLYVDPVRLVRGTRIDVVAWYDNSEGNPLNPHSPPQRVTWGEQTDEEMGICHFRYICDTRKDLVTMNTNYVRYAARQQRLYSQLRRNAGLQTR